MQMINNRLKEIRMREYMMNQKDFAKYLEVSNNTLNNWESGNSCPTLETAFLIADKLNKRIDDIWRLEK
jgi:putative transcriptional regulator